jgi:DNA repair protein RecO (recombination protein O)
VSNPYALLLKRTDYRDADLIVTLFTTDFGKIQALARSARNSRKRFAGALEPIHTLLVDLEVPKRGDLFELRSAEVFKPRVYLAQNLGRLQAAGKLLNWLREALPERTREPELWALAEGLLDTLDSPQPIDERTALAVVGLHLLSLLGWELDFENCVRCGRPCPPNKPGTISAARGGLVCSSCGGGKTRLDADLRQRLVQANQGVTALRAEDTDVAVRLVEEALAAHANLT